MNKANNGSRHSGRGFICHLPQAGCPRSTSSLIFFFDHGAARMKYSASAASRTPVEIWSMIIRLATKWNPIPSSDDYALKQYSFFWASPRCHLYHEFLANERARLRMGLVCRAWNSVIRSLVLVDHLVISDSDNTSYWPSQEGLSRATCIEIEYEKSNCRRYCHCTQVSSANPEDWNPNLAVIPHLQSQEKDDVGEEGTVSFNGPIKATVLMINCESKAHHLQLLKNAPFLQALSWRPAK